MTILMVSACDKVPLAAPTGTTLTLFASRTTVGLNGSVDITATAIESAGTAVQNGTVVTFSTTLGAIEPAEARTNGGKVTVRLVTGSQSGTAEVRAFSGGAVTAEALKISVGAAAAAKIDLLANPSALPASGGVVQLSAIVNDTSGNRLAGVPVSFTTDAGVLAQTSVISDANGEARSALTTTARSTVTASVVGGTGTAGALTASLAIPVRLGPTVTISAPTASLVPGVPAAFTVSVTKGDAAVRAATIDFGDGDNQSVAASGASTAVHTYDRSGTYIVTAVASDTAGETTSATASVSVQTVIVTASMTVSSTTLTTTVPAEFFATATTNPTTAIVERFEWDFGDGSTRTTSGGSTSHLYAKVGHYTVAVRVVTTTGASGTAKREIVVQ
jgi:adhesin/invasin